MEVGHLQVLGTHLEVSREYDTCICKVFGSNRRHDTKSILIKSPEKVHAVSGEIYGRIGVNW